MSLRWSEDPRYAVEVLLAYPRHPLNLFNPRFNDAIDMLLRWSEIKMKRNADLRSLRINLAETLMSGKPEKIP